MIITGIGVSFVGICMGTGGLLTYLGIERKYKLIDKKEAHRILEETFGVIKKGITEEAATVNNKLTELQEENMNLNSLFTEISTKNELLEQVNEKLKNMLEEEQQKNKNKKGAKKTTEDIQDSILQAEAERLAASAEFQDFPLPTDDDIPTPPKTKGRKKSK